MSSFDYGEYRQKLFRDSLWRGFAGYNRPQLGQLGMAKTNTSVDAIRPELDDALIKYQLIEDCLGGEYAVKSKGEQYLPRPSQDLEVSEDERYRSYITRATFLGATALTQRTIVGKLFMKPPTIELPQVLEPLRENANGEGLAFSQLMEKCLAETFAYGRCGLYADFRNLPDQIVSIADTADLYPTITFCSAKNIINWRVDKVKKRLTMVVIKEKYETYDGFAVKIKPQYRVFLLDESDTLVIRVYRATDSSKATTAISMPEYEIVEEYRPLLPGGRPWMRIPFVIMGSTDNDWAIDSPPLYQIATYEIALYRNSADLEEAAFLVGQPTPWVSGMTQEYAEELGITNLKLGSGKFLPLEPSSQVGLLQASPHTMLNTLVEEKMKVLKHLGATVFSVDSLGQDQTATGAVYQALQIHAPLISTSRNVVEGVNKAIRLAGEFIGVDPESEEIEIKINSDVLDNPLGMTGIQSALQLWNQGALTWEEMREQLRVQGLTIYTAAEARQLIDEEGLGDLPPDDEPQRPTAPEFPPTDSQDELMQREEGDDGREAAETA